MKYKRIGHYTSDVPFYYIHSKTNTKVTDLDTLEWIKSLKIPPAYSNVAIEGNRNAKILAVGYDTKNRKQYIYNPKYVEKRSLIKYNKILELNNVFNEIIEHIERDMQQSKDQKTKEIALIIYLIIFCGFRIGNKAYEKSNGSYGISTIKYKHIKLHNKIISFDFIGKKGVRNQGQCSHPIIFKHLSKKRRAADDIDASIFNNITSSDVNEYLKQFHKNITSKDLRTWNANTLFIKFATEATKTDVKDPVKHAIQQVAEQLHNTVAVCKKNYIDPKIIQAIEIKIKNDMSI